MADPDLAGARGLLYLKQSNQSKGGGGGWTPPPVNSMKNALIIVNIRSYRGKVREVLYFEAYVFFHRFVNCVTTFTSTAFQSEDPDDNRI